MCYTRYSIPRLQRNISIRYRQYSDPCNYTLCHEGEAVARLILKLHAPATLLLRKEPHYPPKRWMGRSQSGFTFWWTGQSVYPGGNQTPTQLVALSQYGLSYICIWETAKCLGYAMARDLIPGKGKKFLSSPKRPDWLWSPANPLFKGYRRLFTQG